jgi:histidinol-phosphate/aromatic aminotransferase/cobyric acid decarboxylase-like protein
MKILLPTPSFGEYERIFKQNKTFYYNGFYGVETSREISNQLNNNDIDLVVIVNPNNPTGSLLTTPDIEKLISAHPKTWFLVDESFHDFSDELSLINSITVDSPKRLIYLKSLSKSLGIPGIRLGFAVIQDKELMNKFVQHLGIWHMSSLSEYFIELMLKFKKEFKISIDQTISDRNTFMAALKLQTWAFKVFPSSANFILVETGYALMDLHLIANNLLIDHNILIKILEIPQCGSPRGFMRLAVRKESENLLLIKKINDITNKYIMH